MLRRLRPRPPGKGLIIAFGVVTMLIVGLVTLVVGARMVGHYSWTVERLFRPAPEQPIAFPHPQHVDAGIDCVYCHRLAPEERMASIPPVEQCTFCHQIIRKDSPEVVKLVGAFQAGVPIDWVRVHRLPDHVRFVHEAHVSFFSAQDEYQFASATCAVCHGDVGSMQQVRQDRELKMGDCVNCHRQWSAPTDCVTCHY